MVKKQYDIFISYSRQDMAVADKICAALDNAGITYFIDRQGISGGLEFPELLAENIISSKLFLFLASKHSYGSKFTNNEITFAFNEKPKNTILPYIIDGSQMPNTMRFIFSGINWRTIENHPIETILIDDLLNLLGRERVSEQSQIEVKAKNINNRRVYINRNLLVSISFIILVSFSLWIIPLFIIHVKYDNIYSYKAGRQMVGLQGLKGFVNEFGIEIIPCKYDDAYDFNEGLARVKLNGKYGFVDKIGKEIIPLKYDYANSFSEGLACVKLNDKYGFVDKTGKEVIPLKYDDLANHYFKGSRVKVRLNDKWFYIDKNGNKIE